MAIRRVRVGAVGLGRLGAFHAANLAGRVPGAELVRVVDSREDVARTVAERVGGVDWSTGYDTLVGDPGIDAIAISTNTESHAELIERAAAAGKHVFCEKPLALDLEGHRRAIDAVRRAGVKLQVGFHRRFDPDHRAARAKVASGEAGEVRFFRATFRDARPPDPRFLRSSGGLFTDITLHDFDQARWMVGEIAEVTAKGAVLSDPGFVEIGDVDNGVVVVGFESGALGVIDTSRTGGYGCECSLELMGSEETLRIGENGAHRRLTLQTMTHDNASQDYVQDFMERFPGAFVAEMEAFVRCVANDEEPEVGGAAAAAAFAIAQATWRSYREGRTVRLESEAGPSGVLYREAEQTLSRASDAASRQTNGGANG